jgi:two-component system nitrogen regulation response regulator NtrX
VELVGQSRAVGRVREFLVRAAGADGGVLIAGEEGTDLDSIARELHARSRHAAGPFVALDCAGADGARLDRLLFGAAVGAPASDLETVAADASIAAARGGMLFLAHVTELPAAAQARIARVVRDGEVRIGGVPAETSFRVVASAAPDIDADVDARRFRADLYRRLTAVRIDVPPLRERRDVVPSLAERLLEEACNACGVKRRCFTQAALALLGAWSWPGNLAELRAVITRIVSENVDEMIHIEHILPVLRLQRGPDTFEPAGSLREARLRFERDYIAAVLQHHGWDLADAAQTLGIQRPNLYRKARQLGIPLTRVAG